MDKPEGEAMQQDDTVTSTDDTDRQMDRQSEERKDRK